MKDTINPIPANRVDGVKAIVTASAAGGLWEAHTADFLAERALWAGGCALFAAFVVSGLLPFIESRTRRRGGRGCRNASGW